MTEENSRIDSDAIEVVASESYEQRTKPGPGLEATANVLGALAPLDPELEAMATIIRVLIPLDRYTQSRVMNWVERRLRNIP